MVVGVCVVNIIIINKHRRGTHLEKFVWGWSGCG